MKKILLVTLMSVATLGALQSFKMVTEEVPPGVKCGQLTDPDFYCKDGDTFNYKCATTVGKDNCKRNVGPE